MGRNGHFSEEVLRADCPRTSLIEWFYKLTEEQMRIQLPRFDDRALSPRLWKLRGGR